MLQDFFTENKPINYHIQFGRHYVGFPILYQNKSKPSNRVHGTSNTVAVT